jgi:hypothetical protein
MYVQHAEKQLSSKRLRLVAENPLSVPDHSSARNGHIRIERPQESVVHPQGALDGVSPWIVFALVYLNEFGHILQPDGSDM